MDAHKKRRFKAGGVGFAFLLVFMLAWPFWGSHRFEQATLDFRYLYFNRDQKPSDRVVLIDVDDQSLQLLAPNFGRWPWPRQYYRPLLEFLLQGNPKGIFFDIQFTEEQKGTEDDKILGEITVQAQGRISHALQFLTEGVDQEKQTLASDFVHQYALKAVLLQGSLGSLGLSSREVFKGFALPNPVLLGFSPRVHVVNAIKDPDGLSRRVPLLFAYDDHWFPSLSLAALLADFSDPLRTAISLSPQNIQVSGIQEWEGQKRSVTYDIPLDATGNLPLHFYSGITPFEVIPISSVVDSAKKLQTGEISDPSQLKLNPLTLENKLIIIGASAVGLMDLKATPVNPMYPGPYLHATAISNVLQNDFLKFQPDWLTLLCSVLFVILFYLIVLMLEHHALVRILLPVLILAGYHALAIWLFKYHSIGLEMALPSLVGVLALFHALAYMMFIEGAEKKRMQGALSKYLSPAVTQMMIATGQNPQAEVGRAEELSVMFSDIRGFTTLSEKFKPEIVVHILNEYLGRMTDVIFQHQGTLDKFIGDAIMAFWGAPLKDEHHARNALKAALGMKAALVELKKEWKAKDSPIEINVGLGINTGVVIVGNIGSEKRLDYTVIGDNVNLASRIEGLTKQYHVTLLLGERTYELLKDEFVCRQIDLVKVKGKHQAVGIYEPLTDKTDPNAKLFEELQQRFEAALLKYQKGDFQGALKFFKETHAWRMAQTQESVSGGDGASEVFAERCVELMQDPPKNWDGVYVAKNK